MARTVYRRTDHRASSGESASFEEGLHACSRESRVVSMTQCFVLALDFSNFDNCPPESVGQFSAQAEMPLAPLLSTDKSRRLASKSEGRRPGVDSLIELKRAHRSAMAIILARVRDAAVLLLPASLGLFQELTRSLVRKNCPSAHEWPQALACKERALLRPRTLVLASDRSTVFFFFSGMGPNCDGDPFSV